MPGNRMSWDDEEGLPLNRFSNPWNIDRETGEVGGFLPGFIDQEDGEEIADFLARFPPETTRFDIGFKIEMDYGLLTPEEREYYGVPDGRVPYVFQDSVTIGPEGIAGAIHDIARSMWAGMQDTIYDVGQRATRYVSEVLGLMYISSISITARPADEEPPAEGEAPVGREGRG